MMNVNLFQPVNKTCFTKTGAYACCADFEERNGQCYRCASGFTTDFGKICAPCKKNTFGDKCRGDCKCSENQLCHHIHGCIDVTTYRIQTLSSSYYTSYAQSTESFKLTTENTFIRHSSERVSTIATTSSQENLQTSINTVLTKSNDNLNQVNMVAYYAFSGIVLVLLVCLGIVFYKYKMSVKKRVTIIQGQNVGLNMTQENVVNSDTSDRDYEVVDERTMVNLQLQDVPNNDYLEVISSSPSSRSDQSNKTNKTSYLQSGTCAYNSKSYQVDVHIGNDESTENTEKFYNSYQKLIKTNYSSNPYNVLNTINLNVLGHSHLGHAKLSIKDSSYLSRSCGHDDSLMYVGKVQGGKRSKSLDFSRIDNSN